MKNGVLLAVAVLSAVTVSAPAAAQSWDGDDDIEGLGTGLPSYHTLDPFGMQRQPSPPPPPPPPPSEPSSNDETLCNVAGGLAGVLGGAAVFIPASAATTPVGGTIAGGSAGVASGEAIRRLCIALWYRGRNIPQPR